MKRFFTTVLASVMIFMLSVPAYASGTDAGPDPGGLLSAGTYSIDPDPGKDPTEDWTAPSVPTDKTFEIDRTKLQTGDAFYYNYCLQYQVSDGLVRDLVLYDYIESGSDSRFAGALESVVVQVSSSGGYREEPLEGRVYVRTDSGSGSLDLSGTVLEKVICESARSAGNLSGWQDAGPFTTGSSGEAEIAGMPAGTREVAVVFDGMKFSKSDTVLVWLNMRHAGLSGNTGTGTTLYNYMSAGYRPFGTDVPSVEDRDEHTTVKILYQDRLGMPRTGGPGTVLFYAAGACMAAAGAVLLARKCRNKSL